MQVASADGTLAQPHGAGSGPSLPNPSDVVGFRYFVLGDAEVYVYNVPANGSGGYQTLFLVTEVTAPSGYITNNAMLRGTIARGAIVTVPGSCHDGAESTITRGYSDRLDLLDPIVVPGT